MKRVSDKKLFGDIIKVVSIAAFFIVAAYLLDRPDVREIFFDIDEIQFLLKGNGDISWYVMSLLIFTAAGAAIIGLGVPRIWVTIVAGGIYGALMGSLISMISSLIGAVLIYLAGKTLLAAVVERRLRDRLLKWRGRFQENAFWWVLYARLFPFANSTLTSMICGGCRVPFTPYLSGSAIGFAP